MLGLFTVMFLYHPEWKPTIITEETRPGASDKSEDGCSIFQPLNQGEVDILHTPTPSGMTYVPPRPVTEWLMVPNLSSISKCRVLESGCDQAILRLFWCGSFFKVFIEFVIILLLLYALVFRLWGNWNLSSPTRDWIYAPCIGRRSLNHWTTREVSQAVLITENSPGRTVTIMYAVTQSLHHKPLWAKVNSGEEGGEVMTSVLSQKGRTCSNVSLGQFLLCFSFLNCKTGIIALSPQGDG